MARLSADCYIIKTTGVLKAHQEYLKRARADNLANFIIL